MNTKKLAILASAIIAATCAQAAKQLVDGYTWEYTVANGEATVTGVEPRTGDIVFPRELGGCPVTTVGYKLFYCDSSPSSIRFSDTITRIESFAFYVCHATMYIPSSVKYIGSSAISNNTIAEWDMPEDFTFGGGELLAYTTVAKIRFMGKPLFNDRWNVVSYQCKRKYGKECAATLGVNAFAGYIDDMPEVEIVSSSMRKDDPTVMDVVYKVHSSAQTVKVRAMAWENGERNLSKAIRPTKWIEGTEANIGDAITANEEHKLSWRIAGDWATDLSKVKLEVLAVEDDLLPLELQTIPATATHQKMKISWNKMTADHVFDALLWLYADGDAGLTLTNGQLKNGANLLASGTSLYNSETAVGYVFGKMGYQKLAGDELAYARRVTQLELPVSGVQQFAVKYPDAQ